MLILTRGFRQKIVIDLSKLGIDKKILIGIGRIKAGVVQLGFDCDREIEIWREEVLLAKKKEKSDGEKLATD